MDIRDVLGKTVDGEIGVSVRLEAHLGDYLEELWLGHHSELVQVGLLE